MTSVKLPVENKFIQIIVEPRYRWVRHMCLLLIGFVAYNSTLMVYSGNVPALGNKIFVLAMFQFMLYISVAYFNIYILIPRLFLKKRYTAYFLILVGALTIVFLASYSMEYYVHTIYHFRPNTVAYLNENNSLLAILTYYLSETSIVGMCCVGTTIPVLFRNWFTDGMRRSQLEAKQFRSQLMKIKNSVNPAFLSRTLEVAADREPAASADILGRLSRFLRYRLYDSTRGTVMLNSEIDFLDNYLSLVGDIREWFGYSLNVNGQIPPTAVPPSVLINIMDIILERIREDSPVDIRTEISACSAKEIRLSITVNSPGIQLSADTIEKTIGDILGLTFPSAHSLNILRSAGRVDISVTLNSRPKP